MSNVTYLENVISTRPFGWEFTDRFHFSFEEWDHPYWYGLILSNWKFAFYTGALYIVVIFGLQWWMRDRTPLQLKMPLFWWNLCLGIFSIVGFCRTFPGFLGVLGEEEGFYQSICVKRHLDIPTTHWSLLFIFSKFVELGDTIFIVLRCRPLIFLQWYHHLVTMWVSWIIAPQFEPINRWYMVLNYGVHGLMYNYFALKAKGFRIPNYVANIITTLQFAQMIVGFTVNTLSTYYYKTGHNCARFESSMQSFSLLYGSFLLLFGNLFYSSVFKKGRMIRHKLE